MRRLIPYAGWEPPTGGDHSAIPVARAVALRDQGLPWKEVARELTIETNRETPYTPDAVHAAVMRERKKSKCLTEGART